jgi:hypothetical protein
VLETGRREIHKGYGVKTKNPSGGVRAASARSTKRETAHREAGPSRAARKANMPRIALDAKSLEVSVNAVGETIAHRTGRAGQRASIPYSSRTEGGSKNQSETFRAKPSLIGEPVSGLI